MQRELRLLIKVLLVDFVLLDPHCEMQRELRFALVHLVYLIVVVPLY